MRFVVDYSVYKCRKPVSPVLCLDTMQIHVDAIVSAILEE